MIRNSFICKLINVQASMKENNEKKIKNCDEISKLIKAFPKDIAALDKRSVLAKVKTQPSETLPIYKLLASTLRFQTWNHRTKSIT